MTDLSNLVLNMYPADHGVGDSIKIAQDLEGLSMEELAVLAGVDQPTLLEKRAFAMVEKASMYDDSDDKSWLEQFEGTPLAQAAIALCEQELEQRAKHLQKRIERRRTNDYEDEWTERDQLCLQKKRLELALHKHKAAPAAPTAPAPQAGAPQTSSSASGAGMMGHNGVKTSSKSERRKDRWDSRAGNAARGAVGAGAAGAAVGGTIGAGVGHTARKAVSFATKERLRTPEGRQFVKSRLEGLPPGLRKKLIRTLKSKWKIPAAGAAILGTAGGLSQMPAGAVGGASARIKKSSFEIMKAAMVGQVLKMTSILGKGGRAAGAAAARGARGAAGMEARAARMAAASRARGATTGAAKSMAKPPPLPAAAIGKARPRGFTAGSRQAAARTQAGWAAAGM